MLSGRCPKVLLKLSLAHWGEQERRGGGVGGDGGRGVRWSQHRHDEVVLQHRVAEGAAPPVRLRAPHASLPRRNTLCLSADVQSVRNKLSTKTHRVYFSNKCES